MSPWSLASCAHLLYVRFEYDESSSGARMINSGDAVSKDRSGKHKSSYANGLLLQCMYDEKVLSGCCCHPLNIGVLQLWYGRRTGVPNVLDARPRAGAMHCSRFDEDKLATVRRPKIS